MNDRFLVVPAMGADGAPLRVPFPGRDPIRNPLSADGEVVAMSNFWARRQMHGEVTITPFSEAIPTESPAPTAAPEEPQETRTRRKDVR